MNTIINFMKNMFFCKSWIRQDSNKRLHPVSVSGGQRGFSLVELLIAMGIALVVSAAIYSMYDTFFKSSVKQDLMLEAEQNARAAGEVMERELQNAGYLAGTMDAVTKASASNIEFIYTDPSASSASTTAGDKLKVEYIYDSAAQTVKRIVQNLVDGSTQTGLLVTDVKNFTITYFDTNGVAFVPTDQTTRNTIRHVDINMVTQTSSIPLGSTVKSTFALTLHLKLRNIDIAQAATDTTAPDAPSISGASDGVRDPGQCGRLSIKWTPSTAGDVAGYKVYYGTSSGNYTGVISIPKGSLGDGSTFSCTAANGPCTLFPTVSPFQYSSSDGVTTVPYYFAMKSYDNSLNHSAYSTEITGAGGTTTLAGSNAVFGSGSNDTTVNPKKPVAATGLRGANGNVAGVDVDERIDLSWNAYDTATYPDVTEMRVYRIPYASGTPFTYPISPGYYLGSVPIGTNTYSDSAGLTGCDVYRYAIAPVNCDTSLITMDVGDVAGATQDKTPYYQSYNYNETYGDGSSGNVFSNIADSPSGSDTSPLDAVKPDEPVPFAVRAGYKRVAVQFTQPAPADIAQTCVYVATGATAPVVDANPLAVDSYNCSMLNSTPTAARVPEYNGVFAKPAYNGSFSFWNNSASGLTSTPSLAESGTYSYTAVAYDKCGNRSTSASSSATTTLCGEDPPPPSATKPPAVQSVTVSGCAGTDPLATSMKGSMGISWTPISSDLSLPSSLNNPYDLAGYRLFKSGTGDFTTGGTLLNTVAPYWEPPYEDPSTSDGDVVYYRVYSTDCPFEKGDDTGGVYPTASQMVSKLNPSADIAPVYPARIKRDMKYPVNWTAHREVLTGIILDASGNSTPKTAYTHDTVTAYLYNNGNSASSMTITGMSLSWVNSNAYLKQVKIGGGSSGISESTVATLATSQTTSVTGNDPYSSAVSNISFGTGKVIRGGSTSWNTPIKFYFTDSLGNAIDMRGDQLLMTLNLKNDSTGTTTCTSYLTVSQAFTGITVPLGPSVTSITQDQPSSPTFPYMVPGTSGLETVPTDGTTLANVKVPGGSTVTVTATIVPQTYDEVNGATIPIMSAYIYYTTTDITTGTAPSPSSGTYSSVAMSNSSGNLWSGVIPTQDTSSSAKRVWYYVVGIDSDGNYDIFPAKSAGQAVYDQKMFAKCDYTPSAPTGGLSANTLTATYVSFSWSRVTKYTTGGTINTTLDPLFYRVYRKITLAGAYGKTYDVPDGDTGGVWKQATTTVAPATSSWYYCNSAKCYYWDYIPTTTNDISYYVQAKNSCGADTNLSAATGTYRECQGSTAATFSITPTGPITVGTSYTIKVDDCTLASNPNDTVIDTLTAGNISARGGANLDKVMTETSTSSGSFSGSVSTQKIGASTTTGVYVNPTDLIDDVVTVSCPTCTGAPAPLTITVKASACSFTPATPATFTGTTTKSGNTCTIALSWTASTSPDVTSYEIYKKAKLSDIFPTTAYAVAGAVTTWADPVTYAATGNPKACAGTYYYMLKAVDSCPLKSGSLTHGPR